VEQKKNCTPVAVDENEIDYMAEKLYGTWKFSNTELWLFMCLTCKNPRQTN
jgi:hypothetical protein